MIRLRAALQHEIRGGREIWAWHLNYLRTEAERLPRAYPTAGLAVESDLTALTLEATRRARDLENRMEAVPRRRRSVPE